MRCFRAVIRQAQVKLSTFGAKRLKAARAEPQSVMAESLLDQARDVFGGLFDCGSARAALSLFAQKVASLTCACQITVRKLRTTGAKWRI